MIVDRLENWRRYFQGESWCKAFEYLIALPPDAPEGITEIQGRDIYARVMSYETVSEGQAALEAHREYIDIQASLVNDERIDWFPLKGLIATDNYDTQKDAIHYHLPGPALAQAVVQPGMFAVLFPEDTHMPKLITDKPHLMKKVVIKLRVGLI